MSLSLITEDFGKGGGRVTLKKHRYQLSSGNELTDVLQSTNTPGAITVKGHRLPNSTDKTYFLSLILISCLIIMFYLMSEQKPSATWRLRTNKQSYLN